MYARINEGASFAVSWQSMYESHSAKSVERNEKPFTSVTAQNFTEAMKVFSAQRCDRRQLVHLQSVFKDCVSDLSCTCAVKTSLALIRGCAACGVLPLSSIHDGSHCIRSLHTSGRSYGPPLNRSVFSNESWDPNTPKIVKTCPKKVCLVDASLDGGPRAKRVDRRASSGAFNQHAPFSFRNVKAARKCR